jgi:NDP-sugar pyrophosphorylase family protein
MDVYVRLAREGQRIEPYDVTGCAWIDVGKPEKLAEANRRVGEHGPG